MEPLYEAWSVLEDWFVPKGHVMKDRWRNEYSGILIGSNEIVISYLNHFDLAHNMAEIFRMKGSDHLRLKLHKINHQYERKRYTLP